MRHESLGAAEDPGDIAAAQLLSGSERQKDAHPGGIGESASPLDRLGERTRVGQLVAHTLGDL